MRRACRPLQSAGSTVEYGVKYHKLDQAEMGGQTWFAKHCNAVRGACVLQDVGQNQRPRVAKLYCGMGTEGHEFAGCSDKSDVADFLIFFDYF